MTFAFTMKTFNFLLTLMLACHHAAALNATQWRSQSVYQILTDRFALTTDNYAATCSNLGNYCGGTFQGIINHLPYIQNMGFTAIWISPVVGQLNQSDPTDGEAYHGYWAQNIYQINPRFGKPADLVALSTALHNRGMYLMVDVVTNHMGYEGCPTCTDYSVFYPFNSQSYYHPNCTINYGGGGKPYNLTNIEQCWEVNYPTGVNLPDLRTENSNVQSGFNTWIKQLVANYSIDGLRVDSVQQVNPSFWSTFRTNASVYMVGEVFDTNSTYACSYQGGGMDGILNYPNWGTITSAFQTTTGSMSALSSTIQQTKSVCSDTTILGSFLENHDNPRFSSLTSDSSLIKNAIAITMLADGVPILYYGQEQAFYGGSVPYNREILWPSQYNQSSPLYVFVGKLNALRNRAIYMDSTYVSYKAYPVSYTSNTILIRKGVNNAVIGLYTNLGQNGAATSFSIPSSSTGYSASQSIVEVLSCTSYTTDASGTLSGQITTGLPQIFYPTSALVNNGLICPALTNMCSVLFEEIATTYTGQTIKIAGDAAQLGAWNTSNAVPLSAANYTASNHEWFGTVTFVAGTVIQYKAINVSSGGSVTYEGGSNHVFTVPTGCTTTVTASAAFQT